jgi:hypothetical protein
MAFLTATLMRSNRTGKSSPVCAMRCLSRLAAQDISDLKISIAEVKQAIFSHPEFAAFKETVAGFLAKWSNASAKALKGFTKDGHPKALIKAIAEDLLATFKKAPLLDACDVYQHLMDYFRDDAGRLLSDRR